jgi:hypothetical protein
MFSPPWPPIGRDSKSEFAPAGCLLFGFACLIFSGPPTFSQKPPPADLHTRPRGPTRRAHAPGSFPTALASYLPAREAQGPSYETSEADTMRLLTHNMLASNVKVRAFRPPPRSRVSLSAVATSRGSETRHALFDRLPTSVSSRTLLTPLPNSATSTGHHLRFPPADRGFAEGRARRRSSTSSFW